MDLRRSLLFLALLPTFVGLASMQAISSGTASMDDAPVPLKPLRPTVIAFLDTGINPYHVAFRSPDTVSHPSTFLAGYPEDAVELRLSLEAGSYDEALDLDAAVWESIEPGILYHVPGTKIVGAIVMPDVRGGNFLDIAGHGTAITDAAVGNAAGTSPESLVVHVRGYGKDVALRWVAAQSWIDFLVLSSMWPSTGTGGFTLPPPEPISSYQAEVWSPLSGTFHMVDSGRVVFQGAGNGPFTSQTVVNSFSASVPPWVFAVGGWITNGGSYPFLCTWCERPFDAAARYNGFFAVPDSMTETRELGGTSLSGPTVAGYAANLLADARSLLADDLGYRDGWLVKADSGAALPGAGPLSDGLLSGRELEDVLRATARPFPHQYAYTGTNDVPAQARLWYEGYGLIDDQTVDEARIVLFGEAAAQMRPWDDYWHSRYDDVMTYYWSQWVCIEASDWQDWTECPYDPAGAIALFEDVGQWLPPS